MNEQPLRVLIVEDSEDDTALLLRDLRKAGYVTASERVDTAAAMQAALDNSSWDIIIADYSMPEFDALGALRLVQEKELDLPFIILSGTIGESVAVAAMRAGAHDYIMKGNVARLIPAIERELKEAEVRRERRRAEEALRQAQKLESLGLLAGGVAHDFNNLLVAMMGQCSMALSKVTTDSRAHHHLVKTMEAAERAAELTQQMLSYAGRGRVKLRRLCLNDLIRENLELLASAIPGNVQLQEDLLASLPLIAADTGQMQQVVMNLILNAAEAIEERPGTVAVKTSVGRSEDDQAWLWTHADELDENRDYVMMDVSDTGIGMDAETVARIFDPFFTTKKNGRGLGLASVLGIVRGHKGGLSIMSEPGVGTVFRLRFPTMAGAPQVKQSAVDRVEPKKDEVILVIDDEETVRDAITDVLEMEGMAVVTAANGSDGVDLYRARAEEVGLILLDLSLPGLSGEDTLRLIQEINPDVRVLLSSGYSPSAVAEESLKARTVTFLQKPFDGPKLINAIRKQLRTNGQNGSA